MFTRFTLLISILLIALLTFSCAATSQNTYKVLSVSFQTYDTVLTAVSDLYKQGHISEVQKQKVINAGSVYKEAHNAAVAALLQYTASDNLNNEEIYLRTVSTASVLLAELIRIATPLIEENK
jgi:hypothetical protein